MSSLSPVRSRWLLMALAGSLVVAAAVGVVLWTKGGPAPGKRGSGSSTTTASETIAGEGTEAQGGVSAPVTGGGGAKSSAGSSNGGAAATGTVKPEGDFYLRLAWWNDTEERPAKVFLVTAGTVSWTADTAKRSQVTSIGPFRVGKKLQLVVFPDGRDGPKLVVPFTIRQGMVSGSEQDGIHVEVRDTTVRVLGNAVDNFEQMFERP